MVQAMTVAFVISSMAGGGAARVMSIMANYWVKKDWKIAIITLDSKESHPSYNLNSHIQTVPLGLSFNSNSIFAGLWNNVHRILALRKKMREICPHVVISFIDQVNVLTLFAVIGLDLRVIVSERTDPNVYSIGALWGCLRWWIYGRAERIVVQSNPAGTFFSPKFKHKLSIISNPVVAPSLKMRSQDGVVEKPFIISMGRLSQEKEFDLLLHAFAEIKDRHDSWSLIIIGEGPERESLESLSRTLRIVDRVNLIGTVNSPAEYLQKGALYVLTSRFEGFPNALCEAMVCGLPVIATDCPSGPREIIEHNVNGLLVPVGSIEQLALAMDRLMSDRDERFRLGNAGLAIAERFNVHSVMALWEDLLAKPRT